MLPQLRRYIDASLIADRDGRLLLIRIRKRRSVEVSRAPDNTRDE